MIVQDLKTEARSVDTPHGKLSYHVAGEGPALFLLHGSGPGVTGMENFAGNLPFYASRFRTYVPDLPGYGASDPSPDGVDRAPEAIIAMMDALGIERASVIGNSYGGIVASRFAASYPDRTERIVLIGGLGYNVFSPFPNEGINLLSAFVEDPTADRLRQWLHSMVWNKSLITDELVERRLAQALEPTTRETTHKMYCRASIEMIARMASGINGIKGLEYLGNITCPVLLTWGLDDRVSQMDRALLPMRIIADCQVHLFPRCGHWVMIEAKDEFEAVTMAFLAPRN